LVYLGVKYDLRSPPVLVLIALIPTFISYGVLAYLIVVWIAVMAKRVKANSTNRFKKPFAILLVVLGLSTFGVPIIMAAMPDSQFQIMSIAATEVRRPLALRCLKLHFSYAISCSQRFFRFFWFAANGGQRTPVHFDTLCRSSRISCPQQFSSRQKAQ